MNTVIERKISLLLLIFMVLLFSGCAAKYDDSDGIAEWNEIRRGDFGCITDDDVRKMLQSMQNSPNSEHLKWVCQDVNHDGKKELILQEKGDRKNEEMKCIVGIFALTDNGVKTVKWDVIDMVEYFAFCNDQLVYCYNSDGLVGIERFEICEYDEDWNVKRIGGLEKNWVDDADEVSKEWRKENPDVVQEGVYYRIFSIEETSEGLHRVYTIVAEERWKEEFYRLFQVMYNS